MPFLNIPALITPRIRCDGNRDSGDMETVIPVTGKPNEKALPRSRLAYRPQRTAIISASKALFTTCRCSLRLVYRRKNLILRLRNGAFQQSGFAFSISPEWRCFRAGKIILTICIIDCFPHIYQGLPVASPAAVLVFADELVKILFSAQQRADVKTSSKG